MIISVHLGVTLAFDGVSIGSIVAVQDIVVMVEPVPLRPVSTVKCYIADKSGDSLAEKVRQTGKLGPVSRSVVVKLIDGDSVKLHVAWDSKHLCDESARIKLSF